MRAATFSWLTRVFLLCLGASVVAGQDRQLFQVGGAVSYRGTDSPSMSQGHAYLVSGEPGVVFGCFQDGKGNWQLNYLVLIKHSATATSKVEFGMADPTESSASSDGKICRFNFSEALRIDNNRVAWHYAAQFDQATDELLNETMTVLEKPIDLDEGRIFVIDMTGDVMRSYQVKAPLPSGDQADLFSGREERYKTFIREWIADLATQSEFVAKTFDP